MAKLCWFESHVDSCLSFNLKPFDSSKKKTLKEHEKLFNATIPYNLSTIQYAGRSYIHNHLQGPGSSWPISLGPVSDYIVHLTTKKWSNRPENFDLCLILKFQTVLFSVILSCHFLLPTGAGVLCVERRGSKIGFNILSTFWVWSNFIWHHLLFSQSWPFQIPLF